MSSVLYRLGRAAAGRPWIVVAGWLAASALVVLAAVGLGRPFDPAVSAPGLDSQQGFDLLASAGLVGGGLTADVVATPGTRPRPSPTRPLPPATSVGCRSRSPRCPTCSAAPTPPAR